MAVSWQNITVSQKTTQRHFFFSTLRPLSPVIFATATVVALVLLPNSWFNFRCCTQREATPTQKSAWKWCCDPSRLFARRITKGIHSRKPASLNCPIGKQLGHQSGFFWAESCTERVQNAKWYAMGTWWSLSMGLAEVCKSEICWKVAWVTIFVPVLVWRLKCEKQRCPE